MTIYMLHFGCSSEQPDVHSKPQMVDACVIGGSLEQAEAVAREVIEDHDYRAGDLIAFSRLEDEKASTLSDYEAALYLKALQRKPKVAVVFS